MSGPASTATSTGSRDDVDETRPPETDIDPMRIALVVYGDLDSVSGGFRYDREVVSRLRDRGDTVEVVSLPPRRYGRGLADCLDPRIRDRLDRDVDVLVEDGLCQPSVWRHNRRLTGPDAVVGLIHYVRSDDPTERFPGLIRPFERRFLRSVDATVATSGFTDGRTRRVAPRTEDTPRTVARPAGRMEGRAVSERRVRERAGSDPLRVVFVGTLLPNKNLRTLLDALSRLDRRADGPDWRLTVAGGHAAAPGHADRLVAHAAALGLDDRVTFAGELDSDGIANAFTNSHICCVPARYEGFGMAHLEAMEHGVVPIAGSVGGTSEFLRHGENGFLVDPDDDRAIADRLASLSADRRRLADTGVAALHTAETHPTWSETTARIRGFLRAVIDGNASDADDSATGGGRP